MALMLYQYIGIIIGIVGLIYSFIRFRESKMSLGMLLIWSVVWIVLIFLSIFPDATVYFADLTGIGRGLDVILILGLIGCFYLIFRIYNKIEYLSLNSFFPLDLKTRCICTINLLRRCLSM